MVIISTSAIEVSIQAVSPELGAQSLSTAFFGSGLPAQAGGPASAAGAAAGGAASSAYEAGVYIDTLSSKPNSSPNTRAKSPARVGFLNVMVLTPVAWTFLEVRVQSAAVSVSPVRMRTAVSMPSTKI